MTSIETCTLIPDVFGLLLRRREELRAALANATAESIEARHDPAEIEDFKELAQEHAGQAVQDAEAQLLLRGLAQVEAALRRIESGTWGQCTACGEPIAPARLLAVPEAALCAHCQADAEERHQQVR